MTGQGELIPYVDIAHEMANDAGQPGQEVADPLLHRCPAAQAAQAQIASGLLSRPAPDSLIGVEVRAVARQSLPS